MTYTSFFIGQPLLSQMANLLDKSFVVIGNVERELSRMESLMRLLGLENHLLTDTARYNPASVCMLPATVRRRLV